MSKPEAVKKEVMAGQVAYPETIVIKDLIANNKIQIKQVKNKELLKKVNQFNIQRGEAEVIALYWQEKAGLIATDDDNVRKRRLLLNIKIIGTPSILLKLYKQKIIDKEKLKKCVNELKKIGWFHNAVLDKILMEA